MPWFMVGDQMHSAPLLRKITAIEPAAVGLWAAAGSWSSGHLTDGFIPDDDLPWLFPDALKLAQALVTAGAWKRVRNGHEFIPDDVIYRMPAREAVDGSRKSNARRQALFRDAGLKKDIRERDRDLCRYCGTAVRWGKGRAADSGTFDHVDPQGSNTLVNIVVACMACNSRKKDRTPEQALMPLLPAPGNASRNASTQPPAEASREPSLSSPSQSSVVNVIDQSSGRYALAPDDDPILLTVIDSTAKRTGRTLSAAAARTVAANILGARSVKDPAAYVAKAIRDEPDPQARWLNGLAVTAAPGAEEPPWCEGCEIPGRWRYDDDGKAYHCPECGPDRKEPAA